MKEKTFKSCYLIGIYICFVILGSCHRGEQQARNDYPITPVPFTSVQIHDDFWASRLLTNHEVTIPIAFQKAEETGRIDNFRIAGGLKEGKFSSFYPFDDSDVYKNIEAASYSLQLYPDPLLEAYLDTLISYIAAAQEDDGYLYTNRTINPGNTHEMAGTERWVNEEAHSHELYNAGHLYEAAVAHFQATGKRTLLDVAIKNATLVEHVFGWGKTEKAPGHQEIEIGLVKLYRITGNKKYLDLAKFFLDVRGPGKGTYNQMHKKVTEQEVAVGHAVRAQYMYAAMADIAALTGETAYLDAIGKIWSDVVKAKTYVTGGIGSRREIEGFGEPYELPNMEAYCETCASIASAFWNFRMFLLHGEAKYFDVFEKVLYNGLLSGVSLSGDHFFYPNPLASEGQYSRKPWFGCACCPVNITRFLPSLPGYIYAVEGERLFVNLFIGNRAEMSIKGLPVKVELVTDYPWKGDVRFVINTGRPVKFDLLVRIPGWARNEAFPSDLYYFKNADLGTVTFNLNGEKAMPGEWNGYASFSRTWRDGDMLELNFPIAPLIVKAHHDVKENTGKVAFQRGPVMFCLEAEDEFPHVLDLIVTGSPGPFNYVPSLLNGTGILERMNFQRTDTISGDYLKDTNSFYLIPYYTWANRGNHEMMVWIPMN